MLLSLTPAAWAVTVVFDYSGGSGVQVSSLTKTVDGVTLGRSFGFGDWTADATAFYCLPSNRVVEMGQQMAI